MHICCIGYISVFLLLFGTITYAASRIEELKGSITNRNSEIERLEKEIKQYEQQLVGISKEKNTLKNTIRTFDVSIRKFNSDISFTQNKITKTAYTIEKLVLSITEKEEKIKQNENTLAAALRSINEAESHTLMELVLAHSKLSEIWNELANMEQFQVVVNKNLASLKSLKEELVENKVQEQQRKKELVTYKNELDDKKEIVEYNRVEKNKVLKTTESKETSYAEMLADKKQKKEEFLAELLELESQLQLEIDPSAFPEPGSKVLAWPLDDVLITQYFGNTEFAQTTSAYKGQGHNGIDFRASSGTKVKAALAGTVEAIGNTDIAPGCYSYGKWILIRHKNGLSTMYAHLSIIKVAQGQEVATSDTIGFSGNTGYSTGPHLHFTVYATQGVRVQQFSKSINCKNTTIPIADLKAYINPLSYL